MSLVRTAWLSFVVCCLFAAGCQFPGNDRTENAGITTADSNTIDSTSVESNAIQSNSSSSIAAANFESQVASNVEMAGHSSSEVQAEGNLDLKDGVDESEETKIHKKQSLAESFLFHPLKYPRGFDRFKIEGQRVKFTSEDGTKLDGRYFIAPDSKGVIVFCHGNAGNLASRTQRMEQLQKQFGYSFFLFDYRGYGRSEGKPTVSGVLADGRAAVRKAAELAHVKPSEVIVMGRSLGGAIAIQLAAKFKSPKLIVESTFTSFRDIARDKVSFLSGLTRKSDLDSVKAIAEYRGAVLLSHSVDDGVIPYKHGKTLYEKANQPKQFYEVKNAGHNDPMPESYRRILGQFLNQ